MSCLGNIIWMLCGGLGSAIEYFAAGILLCCTIIGIPFGIQCFKIGIFVLWPFGTSIQDAPNSYGCMNTLLNILWIPIAGIWICITHLFFGLLLCITIIGIPFGRKHFQLSALAMTPFGKQVG